MLEKLSLTDKELQSTFSVTTCIFSKRDALPMTRFIKFDVNRHQSILAVESNFDRTYGAVFAAIAGFQQEGGLMSCRDLSLLMRIQNQEKIFGKEVNYGQ